MIELDPLSPWGYERKHAALHKAGRYDDAISMFGTMLLKISQSPDPDIRGECIDIVLRFVHLSCLSERLKEYVNPAQTKAAIHRAVQNAIRNSPRVLINTISGRLADKSQQASLFESLAVFKELISSMTTHIDHAHIQREVAKYYRYATFSHSWEDNEPLFEEVIHIVVYDLEESFSTHHKLQMFCKIARDAGFHWAWSDTCCINKSDHFMVQEALVAMFKWYEGSALTIVFLRGVRSPSRRGDLKRSIWNTRAWTFQEYHASKVVRFYTEDWKLYMNLDIPNHKESPKIISEMEEATNVSAGALRALRPGLEGIREKLYLASRRETTRVEDAAYSLLGIFSVSLPIVYGEEDQALGRLLAQLLTSSGDTSIIAWTGISGSFNSCLQVGITVFNELPAPYIPQAIAGPEMMTMSSRMRTSSPNLALVMKLYDRLHELPVPSFANKRMKLPCLTFKLGPVLATWSALGHVFRAQTAALGIVEIRTDEDLSRFDSLYLVHPWIDFLLDRQPVGSGIETIPEETTGDQFSPIGELPSPYGPFNISSAASPTRTARFVSCPVRVLGGRPTTHPGNAVFLRPPSSISRRDKQTQALRVIARLRQPFGALLLTPDLNGVAAYRRIAAENLITVQVEDITSAVLNKLVDSVRALDVL